jgi:hypothetical protein
MSTQTAVEWYAEQATRLTIDFLEGRINEIQLAVQKLRLLGEAKEMEKEQHSKTFEAGNKRGWSGYPYTDNWTQPTFELHYNERYGNK